MRQTCLYVATKLGDLLHDLIVVGGLVPSLLHPRKWVAINRIRFCYFITSVSHKSRVGAVPTVFGTWHPAIQKPAKNSRKTTLIIPKIEKI